MTTTNSTATADVALASITLPADKLHAVLSRMTNYAGTDPFPPVFAALHLTLHGDHLTVTATDRYILGATRVEGGEGEGQTEFLLPLATVKAWLPVLRGMKQLSATLTVQEGGRIKLQAFADTLTASVQQGEFPKLRGLLTPATEDRVPVESFAYGAQNLARVIKGLAKAGSRRGGEAFTMYRTRSGDGPAFILDHNDPEFVGAVMPLRQPDGTRPVVPADTLASIR